MKNTKLIYGIFAFITLSAVGIAIYLRYRKKTENGKAGESIDASKLITTESGNVVPGDIETKEVSAPIDNTSQTDFVKVETQEIYEVPKPTWFTPEMEKKLKGNYQGYKSGGEAMEQKYEKWKTDWPGVEIYVDNFDDYCIESAIQDVADIFQLTRLQGLELRRYYGIGMDILLPKDKSKPKPSWLNSNDWEYHMWWYFNHFYYEQGYGGIKESFYKGLDQMAHDNGISSDKIQAAKDYYDTSQMI